jgi:hypothetical protein
MRKSILSAVLVAAGISFTGIASAQQTFDSPQQAGEASTMTHGEPNANTTNSPYSDGSHTMILGAPSSTIIHDSSVTYSAPVLESPDTVISYGFGWGQTRGGASASSSVPDRAGEASTMSRGVPNLQP